MVYCDTSFLYSAYAADRHFARAAAALRNLRTSLAISLLNVYELENAFRFSRYRGLISDEQLAFLLAEAEADRRAGRVEIVPVDPVKLVTTARDLSTRYTVTGGHRSFDLLIVASALCLKADRFFSFDARQRRLAPAEGLTVHPN